MSIFAAEKYETIKGKKLQFYKLKIDDEFPIDLFEANLSAKDKKEFKNILSCMQHLADNDTMLPSKKFESVKDGGAVIAYEFKKDRLRIFVKLLKPNILILFGGYKGKQKMDIKKINRLLDQINMEELL